MLQEEHAQQLEQVREQFKAVIEVDQRSSSSADSSPTPNLAVDISTSISPRTLATLNEEEDTTLAEQFQEVGKGIVRVICTE